MPEITNHLNRSYDQELRRLRELMTGMGGMVEKELALAARAVLDRDEEAASAAVKADPAVDAREREVEAFAIQLIALRQPLGGDLREIIACLKMTGDLERMGDYAANVAKRSLVLNQFGLPPSLGALGQMMRLVQENVKLIVDAIGSADIVKAQQVWRDDQAIDDLYTGIFRELITYMMEDPRNITPCTHLLFIAKNLERVGDHATNIAETIYYAVTGETLPDARPKGDSITMPVRPER